MTTQSFAYDRPQTVYPAESPVEWQLGPQALFPYQHPRCRGAINYGGSSARIATLIRRAGLEVTLHVPRWLSLLILNDYQLHG